MPVWHEKHLRAATRAAGVALWCWNVDTDGIAMDEAAYDLWEVPKDERKITFEILSRNIHPADLERVRSAFAATRAVVGAYEIVPYSIRRRCSLDFRSGPRRRR
jgi:PAS domain-containing protein